MWCRYVKSSEIQIWPVLASFIVSILFQGLMALATIVREPFGDDLDDFNIDSMLMHAERERERERRERERERRGIERAGEREREREERERGRGE